MKIYDKAKWHIDGGEDSNEVISRLKMVFAFLKQKNWLNDVGIETFEFAMDSSISLNSTMLSDEGISFLDKYYDMILASHSNNLAEVLEHYYSIYSGNH